MGNMSIEFPVPKSELPRQARSIEETANFEGVDSILTCERARHPVIQKQIVDLLLMDAELHHRMVKEGKWKLASQEHADPSDDDMFVDEAADKLVFRRDLNAPPPTRELIEQELKERIAHVSMVTELSTGRDGMPNVEAMPYDWDLPGQGKPTTKQKAITLAHEKGHRIRPYHGAFFDEYFAPGFDSSKALFTEEDYELYKHLHTDDSGEPISLEDFREFTSMYLFSADELAERMNQLKCYFGMSGNEEFTHGHLAYARQHYIPDTNLDNHMTQFFQAITPETEAAFLRLMNGAGI